MGVKQPPRTEDYTQRDEKPQLKFSRYQALLSGSIPRKVMALSFPIRIFLMFSCM